MWHGALRSPVDRLEAHGRKLDARDGGEAAAMYVLIYIITRCSAPFGLTLIGRGRFWGRLKKPQDVDQAFMRVRG